MLWGDAIKLRMCGGANEYGSVGPSSWTFRYPGIERVDYVTSTRPHQRV
jgi:hypothetical protein